MSDAAALSRETPAGPVVTVRGEAQREVPPDLATLSISLHASGATAERVRTGLAVASNQVAEVIAGFGAAISKHATTGLYVAPVFDRRTSTKVVGYRGSFDTSVVVSDFDRLSDIVFALSALPESQVSGPWWSLGPEHPARREVRIDAIADARRRADDYAAAFGSQLSGLLEVSDLDSGMGQPRTMRAMAFAMDGAAESAPSFDFTPAAQTVSGQVTVRFTISPPEPPVSAQ